jgi:Leucine-rich repeat (LRR) protein
MSLKYLDISYNSIENLDEDTFKEMKSLEYLNLSGNKIKAATVKTLGLRFHVHY